MMNNMKFKRTTIYRVTGILTGSASQYSFIDVKVVADSLEGAIKVATVYAFSLGIRKAKSPLPDGDGTAPLCEDFALQRAEAIEIVFAAE